MNACSFSLLEQPWIPVRYLDGTQCEVGLGQVFSDASRIQGVATSSPVEYIALHRLLLALAHRAVGPGDIDARVALAERWTQWPFEAYLSKFRDRFDLLGAERPFLQVAALAKEKLERRPWTLIALERSSGNAKTLFDHSRDVCPGSVSLADAARCLIAFQQFTNGGLVKAFRTAATRGPASGLACVLAEGDCLAETIALNLIPQAAPEYVKDIPPWEQDGELPLSAVKAGRSALPLGPAQRYAWQSRSVLLFPDDSGVSTLLFAEGVDFMDGPVPDPMAVLVAGKAGLFQLRLSEERAIWRDFHALATVEGSHPPATIETAVALRNATGRTSKTLRVTVGGLLTDKAKLVLWRLEMHRVPATVLAQGNAAAAALRPAAERAAEVGRALREALFSLSRAWLAGESGRSPERSDVESAAKALQAEPSFWQALEAPYWRFVHRLGEGADPDQELVEWEAKVIASARRAWDDATARIGVKSRALLADAIASQAIAQAIRKKFKVMGDS